MLEAPELGLGASEHAPIIIATDGRPESDGALVAGRLLAETPGALRLVSVLRPMPVIPESEMVVMPELEASRRSELQRHVIAQMDRAWVSLCPIEIEVGDPATMITRLAQRSHASLIVAGIGRHRVADRIFGDETALRLIRLADVPVLAAVPGMMHAPKRIVVACDFSESSTRAARIAVDVAAPGATIHLVHVAPRDASGYEWEGWDRSYKDDAGDAMIRMRHRLHVPKSMTVQTVLLQGDAATELLAFASSVQADLIATGSHGYGMMARMLVGSVATRLIRLSTCSVLTVPRQAVSDEVRAKADALHGQMLPRAEWATELDLFSKANAGRRAMLEVDDAELGAQAQEYDYPFRGATYDHHDGRIALMFGDVDGTGHHLTRGISQPAALGILRENGRDIALRVAHGKGQTLLTFIG
jgi:nucleotide-binding universal stress UspA family protein